jgi:hypothetical protein
MNKSKFILFLASIMLAVACSGEDGKDGTSCTLDGNKLTCGDKTLVIENGVGCTLEQDALGKGPAIITCGTNPPLIIPMCNGEIYSFAKNVCDNNGNLYGIVTIYGNLYGIDAGRTQIWMKENLKGGFNNEFTRAAAAGACPNGWRLPSKTDFEILVEARDFANWNGTPQTSWWSSEKVINSNSKVYILSTDNDGNPKISQDDATISLGSYMAVRCIKD